MAFRQRRERLRSILTASTCIRSGSVYDATSIRIAEDLGFELGMFGGSVASLVVLGDPDIALITLTELADSMTRDHDVPFRSAHAIASGLVERHRCNPQRSLSSLIAEVSREEIGLPLQYSDADLTEILAPKHFVEVRRTLGGPAPQTRGPRIPGAPVVL